MPTEVEPTEAPVMSEHNSVVREPGARPDFHARLAAMKSAAIDEAEADQEADDESSDDDEVDTEPAAPKALRPAKEPDKLSKITEKLNKERARLKSKREVDTTKSAIEQERAQMRAEIEAMRQVRAQLQERVSKIDPDDPVALERILEKLGGERVSKFILDQGSPEARARAQASVAPPPRTPAEDDRVAKLEATVNEFFAGQKRQADEAAFKTRVLDLGHDEEGGAPFTAALMNKSPAKALKMAYAVMADIVQDKQQRGLPVVFDDDDIIAKMEEELSDYASLRSLQAPQKQAAGISSRTRQAEQDEPDPADAPAEERAPTKSKHKLSPKEALLRRVEAARRQMNAIDRAERRNR